MENRVTPAIFRIKSYHFTKASLNFDISYDAPLNISFDPTGEYSAGDGEFLLSLTTRITTDEEEFLKVDCQVIYQFDSSVPFKDIPDYFYPNCLAIIFPYIRSFIGTLSFKPIYNPLYCPLLILPI